MKFTGERVWASKALIESQNIPELVLIVLNLKNSSMFQNKISLQKQISLNLSF